ncbi:MAG: metal-dependent hydrolase [Panacagrimonas sp.]
MKIREIDIDFSKAKINWTPKVPEFAQFWNATSTFLPYLEPFLNKAVREGMNRLPEREARLRDDCRIFIAQEGRHYRNHEKFNQKLRESGYPELIERESAMKADYEHYWAQRDLKYCIGYAEGFETLGPILACYFLEGSRELDDPEVDDPTLDLWRWHLAEEYEHRHVCNYLFHRLYSGYWYRLYGIVYAGRHMLTYMIRTALYMIDEDRRAGRISDPWNSRLRFAGVLLRMFAYAIPRLVKSLHPSYDPADIPPPKRSMEILEKAERLWTRKARPAMAN